MSTPVIESPTASYLAAVEIALVDLPAADRAELLDDVRQHLAEVAAETGEDLEATLGEPQAYAADLRAAAGLPPAVRPVETRPSAPGLCTRAAGHPATAASLAFVRSLRPAWWVLRGALVAIGLLVLFAGGVDGRRVTDIVPSFYCLVVLAAVCAAVVSVLLARRREDRTLPWRVVATGVNIAAVVLAVATVGRVHHDARLYVELRPAHIVYETSGQADPVPPGSLTGPNGLIYNIEPYDVQGQPLTGVQLFDQNGNPINVEVGQDPNGSPLTRQVPVSTDGHALDNVFPQTQLVSGGTPAPARTPVAAIGTATAVVPPGPGSPQPVILPGVAVATPSPSASK